MGTPTPPAPAPAPPAPEPPAPPAPTPPAPEPESTEARLARTESMLAEERRHRREAEARLTTAQQANMPEQERLLAAAKAEGRTEAIRAAGLQVAAAEFRALAVGKLADPAAALEVIDLSKFVGEDGEVNRKDLEKLVDRLAASLPAATGAGKVPAGARGDAGQGDWIRQNIT